VQWEKFRFHNSQWLEMVKNQQSIDAATADGDGMAYYHDEMMDPSCLYQLGKNT